MAIYNDSSLFVAFTFEEIEQLYLDKYNEVFNSILSIEQFRLTNIYTFLLIPMQLQLVNENNISLIYNKLIQYLKTRDNLRVNPIGTTFNGLENALLSLDYVEDVNLYTINSDYDIYNNMPAFVSNTPIDKPEAGEIIITVFLVVGAGEGINNQPTNEQKQEIAQVIFNNLSAGIKTLGTGYQETIISNQSNIPYLIKFDGGFAQDIYAGGSGNIELKIEYSYDKFYFGTKLSEEEIKTKVVQRFNLLSKLMQEVYLQSVADLSEYPSLASLKILWRSVDLNNMVVKDYDTANGRVPAFASMKVEIDNSNIVEIAQVDPVPTLKQLKGKK